MKTYKCQVSWIVSGFVWVDADSPEAAAEKALAGDTPLPEKHEYVGDCACDPDADVTEVEDGQVTLGAN